MPRLQGYATGRRCLSEYVLLEFDTHDNSKSQSLKDNFRQTKTENKIQPVNEIEPEPNRKSEDQNVRNGVFKRTM